MVALLSRKDSFYLLDSLETTFYKEFIVASLIETAPTPAKASRTDLLPAILLAIYSDTHSGGRVDQDSSSILIP
jgi:hypothetical protein